MRLLVIRTSAMGDVALTVPVLAGMRREHPDIEIVMVTRKMFVPFFTSVPGLQFFLLDTGRRHKGISGMFRLFNDISRTVKPDKVLDLHDVLRSKILRLLFKLTGVPVYIIDKGRSEKRSLITGKKKVYLKHSVERYSDVFKNAGYPCDPERKASLVPPQKDIETVMPLLANGMLNIGVAPFARHKLKMWPEEYMIRLLLMISEEHKCRFFLFGGKEDAEKMKVFQEKIPGIVNISGTFDLARELALMSRLDLMISMDSSNMHMAALCGTRVISIWGGTDPMAGFGAWMQPDNYSIRIPVEELDCRPCTIYGKGESRRGLECLKRLTPEMVFKRLKNLNVIPLKKYEH